MSASWTGGRRGGGGGEVVRVVDQRALIFLFLDVHVQYLRARRVPTRLRPANEKGF